MVWMSNLQSRQVAYVAQYENQNQELVQLSLYQNWADESPEMVVLEYPSYQEALAAESQVLESLNLPWEESFLEWFQQ